MYFFLTFDMSECAKCSSRTVTCVLYVVALGGLVNLRVELLLGPRVTVMTVFSCIAGTWIAPIISRFDLGTKNSGVSDFESEGPGSSPISYKCWRDFVNAVTTFKDLLKNGRFVGTENPSYSARIYLSNKASELFHFGNFGGLVG